MFARHVGVTEAHESGALVDIGKHASTAIAIMAKSKNSATETSRSAKSRRFVLGSRAFGKISAVEGVVVSRDLMAELRRLRNVTPAKRRAALAHKYGKK